MRDFAYLLWMIVGIGGGSRYAAGVRLDDPDRQAQLAFALIFLGIAAFGALVLWLLYFR